MKDKSSLATLRVEYTMTVKEMGNLSYPGDWVTGGRWEFECILLLCITICTWLAFSRRQVGGRNMGWAGGLQGNLNRIRNRIGRRNHESGVQDGRLHQ